MELWKILNYILGWEYIIYNKEPHRIGGANVGRYSKILKVHRTQSKEPYVIISDSVYKGNHLVSDLEKDEDAKVTWLTQEEQEENNSADK